MTNDSNPRTWDSGANGIYCRRCETSLLYTKIKKVEHCACVDQDHQISVSWDGTTLKVTIPRGARIWGIENSRVVGLYHSTIRPDDDDDTGYGKVV